MKIKPIPVLLATLSLAVSSAIPLLAQEQPKYGKTPERTIPGEPTESHPKKGVDETDQNFMKTAAIGNEAEIQLGQMAQSKASSPQVKSFGERMIKDHSSADDKLKNIADSQHISLPIELDPEHKATAARLSALSGKDFDKAYMQLMVQEHTKDVGEFQKEAAGAHDDTVRQFATATLPVLQSHLNEARQIEQQTGSE